jgi:sugar lactone lactonase YvrE
VFSLGGVGLAATGHHARHHHRLRGAAQRQQAYWQYTRQHRRGARIASGSGSADDGNLAAMAAQYSYERTAPGATVSGQALVDALAQRNSMATAGGAWQEVTNRPYNAQPPNYTDPFWSNVGAGFSLVGGRTTALVQTPDGNWFAGTADGGVWRSSDRGGHWTPTFDSMPSLSIGALAVNPADGSLWVGTGEANTSQDSYAGTGVYRSTDDGASYTRLGDTAGGANPIAGRTVFQIAFAPDGTAYAATNDGLWRMAPGSGAWSEVLAPAASNPQPYYYDQVTTVQVVPGTNGQDVVASVGWRSNDAATSGFYQSTDGGNTFSQVTPAGAINAADIGRTTFAYSADGSKLYAIVQSPAALLAGAPSNLQGVFVSTGSPASVAGPWTLIADPTTLSNSGSANAYGPDSVGAQAWYNQTLAVDPTNPNHVYVGLEEVFETFNGGTTWNTAAPYWNYGLACGSSCPNTTHPDQHALMIADSLVVSGNDGGVYSRPVDDSTQYGGWSDLNRTLRSWQYYDARAGMTASHRPAEWGGLQDNGTSFLEDRQQMVEPAGGDGFDVIVDPANAMRMVGEYVDGTMYSSTDGGHSFYDTVSPTCVGQATVGMTPRPDCDPNARFVTPLTQDPQNTNVWLTGGEFVWVTKSGWNTSCTTNACSWTPVYDTGSGNAITALSSVRGGQVIYAAWVSGTGNPGPSFASGIATNFGGTWHQVNMAGLPNRYIAGLAVDPKDPGHAYAVFNGYSRRWVPGGGVGHVFETRNGGQSWTDISGNLPDIAGDALVIGHGHLALATDAGVFTAAEGQGSSTTWSVLGTGLPNVSVNDLTVGPNGNIYAATHGRGIWRIGF